VRGDERRLVGVDTCLLVAKPRQPTHRGAAIAVWLAVAHEQAKRERVGKRQLRQTRGSCPCRGDTPALERTAENCIGMTLARHEHMFSPKVVPAIAAPRAPRRRCPLWPLVAGAVPCFTGAVVVYGIASSLSRDIDDFYPTAAQAEAALAQIFADEPDLKGALWVERIELELSPN
jgi:hypothetical protein